MLTKKFVAKTKTGVEVIINAENTEKGLITNYTVKCVATKQGALHVVSLNTKEAKELLNVMLPAGQKEALVVLEDQAGWKQFKYACSCEQYEIEQARPKSLKEQREILASEEYNTYSPEYFPGSKSWRRWNKAYNALQAFDALHPEVKETVKNDGFIPTEGRMDY